MTSRSAAYFQFQRYGSNFRMWVLALLSLSYFVFGAKG
jgi:hypothetical protein